MGKGRSPASSALSSHDLLYFELLKANERKNSKMQYQRSSTQGNLDKRKGKGGSKGK